MRIEPVALAIETDDGVSLGRVEDLVDFRWSREMNEVSNLSFNAARQALTADIVPWFTWISCWHGRELQWRGPVQDVKFNTASMALAAKDVSCFMWKTRTVNTRTWSGLDISTIAADMWTDMLDLQGVEAEPVVMPALSTSGRYTVSVTANEKMLQQDMADLNKLGLRWTVARGRPIIGNQPTTVAAELSEADFAVGFQVQRSGAQTSNDVRVQGTNYAHTERLDFGKLHLQSLISIDDVFGVANITAAAREQLRKRAFIKDSLVLPPSAMLMPTAPVELSMLIPGIRMSVSALGVRSLFELQKIEVSGSPQSTDVSLTLGALPDETALEKIGTTT